MTIEEALRQLLARFDRAMADPVGETVGRYFHAKRGAADRLIRAFLLQREEKGCDEEPVFACPHCSDPLSIVVPTGLRELYPALDDIELAIIVPGLPSCEALAAGGLLYEGDES